MMKSLYKYILDEDTGNITVREITEYRVKENEFTHRKTYIHKDRYGTVYTREESFDQLKHNIVYSFDSDILHAKSIIMNNVKIRRAKAKREYERWNGVFEKLRRD